MTIPLKWPLDIYETIFGSMAVAVVSAICFAAGGAIYMDSQFGSVPLTAFMLLVCCWGAVGIMLNLGEPKASAKTVFWGGVLFWALVHALGLLGWFMISMM